MAAHGPSLPPDHVVADILGRLPDSSVASFRAVCRAWNAVTSCPAADHVLAAKRPGAAVTAVIKDTRRLEVDDERRHPVDIVRFDFFRGRWRPDARKAGPCPRAVSLDDMTISTDGFLTWDGVLCTPVFPRKPQPDAGGGYIMLWIPLTNACAIVSVPAGQGRIIGGYAHPVTGRFHLLHSSDVTVSDDSVLVVAPNTDHSVSLNGNLHWLVQLPGSGKKAAALLVFDTVREKFRFMAAPESPGLDPTTARLRVVPGGNKQQLCVLALTKQKQPAVALEVWVLDDYSSEPRRSWRLRETIGLDGTCLSRARFVAAAAVEVVEGVNEGEEVFVHHEDGIEAYSVRSKVWRRVSVGRCCATPLLMYRESLMQPEISFGAALRGSRRGRVVSRRIGVS
nr:unnamed protein product [Digitaria exilis]